VTGELYHGVRSGVCGHTSCLAMTIGNVRKQ
jgi:hypothetical protein